MDIKTVEEVDITLGTGAGPFESLRPPTEGDSFPNSFDATSNISGPVARGEDLCGMEPRSRLEWLRELMSSNDLVSMGLRLAWGLAAGFIFEDGCRAGPTQTPGGVRRCLFPLPVIIPEGLCWEGAGNEPCARFTCAVSCWVALGCAALNFLYGFPNAGAKRKPGKVHRAVLGELQNKVERFLRGETPVCFKIDDVVNELKERKVSYSGEEILQPHPLTAEQIIKGLPPSGHGGSIPVIPFLRGYTKFLMENPLESLLAVEERGSSPVSARVHIVKGQELDVFNLLYQRGIIKWIPSEQAFSDERGTYLNGLFGVIKPGKFCSNQLPALRVIMNFIPVNGLFSVMRGDIDCLPSATHWLPLCLSAGEEISLSQGDMSAAFYLFSIPSIWQRYMCFNFRVQGKHLGLPGLVDDDWYRPTCCVLPMGWSSSVSIMQAVSREILLSKGLAPDLELKKGSPLPNWFAQVVGDATPQKAWWQIYLDNFMSAEVGAEITGLDVELQSAAMAAWRETGVLTAEDKQVIGESTVTELGVRVDGKHGLLGASTERVFKTILASLYILSKQQYSKKEVQIVLGRWVFILQYRRAAMGMLSRSWQVIEHPWPTPAHWKTVERELLGLVCLGPLLQCDLTATYDGEVTVSDASESGGACAISSALTWSGRSFVGMKNDARLAPIRIPVLVVSLFNGIGGAFRLYDVLGLAPAGKVSVDISRPGNRVTRNTWPDVIELHDIESLDRREIQRWAALFPHILELHLFAGFPCVHLSSARACRENLYGEGSRLFWKLLEVISWVQDIFGQFCKVKFCIENVASMDEEARHTISDELGIAPVKLDPSDAMPISRPRFAWCSVSLYEMEGLHLWTERDYFRAYVDAGDLQQSQWIRPGWSWNAPAGTVFPTFMKSIKRTTPPPAPAGLSRTPAAACERWRKDSFRYPPYQYKDQFLVEHATEEPRLLDSTERELLLGFGAQHTVTCMSASEAKKNLRTYEDVRCSLCGDSFSIFSFAIMASMMSAELTPRMSPAQILQRLGLAPGCSVHPSVQVPMTRWLSYGGDGTQYHPLQELSQHLGLSVNHTGSDVKINSGLVFGGKNAAHSSARAWWWQWKHLFKVRWLFKSHINFLEMKMILNTILWKARDVSKINKRWLHLEDSMVCLFILSKGRTSSHLLQPLVNKIGAVQMAMGATLLHAHVRSEENPTDEASRA